MRRFLPYGFIFVSALAPRLLRLGQDHLWYDEAFTALVAGLPPARIAAALAGDVHPPLWYLVEIIAVRLLGSNEAALRLPAALAGALAAVLLLTLAKYWGKRVAWWAVGLYCVMPAPLYYGREGRMYALLTCFLLWGALAVLKRRRVWLVTSALGLLWTHNLGALYVAALALAALASGRGRTLRAVAADTVKTYGVSGGVVLAGYMPWLTVLAHQMQNMTMGGWWLPPLEGLGSALFPLYFVTWGALLPEAFHFHAALLSVALTLVGLLAGGRKWFDSRGRLLLALLFAPPLLALLVGAIWRPIYLNRFFVPSGAILLVVWAMGLARATRGGQGAALAALVPLIAAANLHMYRAEREPASEYIDHIAAESQDGDAIYHMNLATWVVYGYYLPDLPHYVYPQETNLQVSLTAETTTALGVVSRIPEQTNAKRLWLLWAQTPYTSDGESAAAAGILARYPSQEVVSWEDNPLASFEIWLVSLE